jgi:hypothetical protein
MPPIVTAAATVTCLHGGQVTLIPKQTKVLIKGSPVLCEPDLVGSPIVGCPVPPSPGSKPCLVVTSVIPGPTSTSLKVKVGGRPAYIATLTGLTDGVPPGTIMVANPGQVAVQG